MSNTLTRATDGKLGPEVAKRLETEPLATVLRAVTWGSHEEAEFGEFEQALVAGNLRKDVYADLLAQSWAVYKAIEELAPSMADDPIAGPFVRPEVERTEALEKDLAYYYGDDWRDQIRILPITQEYVNRIKDATAQTPVAWIAHGYTRYLADLSGGLVIDRSITAAYGLEQDGRWLYTFDFLEEIDAQTWKGAYRQLLNALEVDIPAKLRLIEEAFIAYQFNIELNLELVAIHDPITDGDPVIDLTELQEQGLANTPPKGHGHH